MWSPSNPAGVSRRVRHLLDGLTERKVFRTAGIYLVVAWGAVEVSATVFPLLGVGDWAPRLVLAIAAAGLPVAVWWAWLFDLGPGGLRPAETDGSDRKIRWSQALAVGAATVVGLTVPIFMALRPPEPGAPSTPVVVPRPVEAGLTVAVLPFVEPGAGEDEAYFGEGIADEVVASLAGVKWIRVLSRAAASRLLAGGRDPFQVGRDLGAGFVREGLTSGGEPTGDLASLAGGAEGGLSTDVPPRSPTRSMKAFEDYLRGNAELARRTPASVARAIASYRNASARDPEFVSALAREAYAQVVSDPDRLDRALPAFEKALALGPGDEEAYHQYGQTLMLLGRDAETLAAYHGTLADARRAMEIDPSYGIPARAVMAVALHGLGEPERAAAELERARPRSASLWFYLRHPNFDPVRRNPRFQAVLADARPEGAAMPGE